MQSTTMPPKTKLIHFKMGMLTTLCESLDASNSSMKTSEFLENDDLDNPLDVFITILPHVAFGICDALQAAQISTAVEVFHKQLRNLALNAPVDMATMCKVRNIIAAMVDLDFEPTDSTAPFCTQIMSGQEQINTQICIVLTRKFAESLLNILSVRGKDITTELFCNVLKEHLRESK